MNQGTALSRVMILASSITSVFGCEHSGGRMGIMDHEADAISIQKANSVNDQLIQQASQSGSEQIPPATTSPTTINSAEFATTMTSDSQQVENSRMLDIAIAECNRLNVPVGERASTILASGDEATVTFHAPEGVRAGDFVIKINRKTGKIIEAKIWR